MANSIRIPLEEAVNRIKSNTVRLPAIVKKLEDICGEVLAEDILAANDQPPFSRSPLDGYAIKGENSSNASKETPVKLKVVGKICAGDDQEYQINSGEAVRIMTGAKIPDSANAVIGQEDTDYGETEVLLYDSVKPFQNYCTRERIIKKVIY